MQYEGVLLGLCTFLIIGAFHPIVIKSEYYFGTRVWWIFLVMGLGFLCASLFIASLFWSCLCAILGVTNLWTILELFEQKERVKKGWFPENPKRKNRKR